MKYTITIELTHLGLEDKGAARVGAALDQMRDMVESENMGILLSEIAPLPAARVNVDKAHFCIYNKGLDRIGTVTGRIEQ